jgi:hypothetical protein
VFGGLVLYFVGYGAVAIFLLWLYFLPVKVARLRRNPYIRLIFAVNVLVGATGIGWIACLVWALAFGDQPPLKAAKSSRRNATF